MYLPDKSFMFRNFIYGIRVSLLGIRSAAQIAELSSEKIPVNVSIWFEKWIPVVDSWISSQENAHSYLIDEKEHDWEQLIFEMAQNMKNISIAYAETKTLEIPATDIETSAVNILIGSTKKLNEFIQLTLEKDFQHLIF